MAATREWCGLHLPAILTEEERMGTFRLYTGADGQSRAETIDIEKTAAWTKGIPTTDITFRTWPAGSSTGTRRRAASS